MAKLTNLGQGVTHGVVNDLSSLLASVCIMFAMIITLLGIKIWWFKHRLSFDQNSMSNGAAGGSSTRSAFSSRTERRGGANKTNSKDTQVSPEVHGIFRKRHEDEWDVERPAVLPPVRLAASTPDLNVALLTANAKENFGKVSSRKQRKEIRSAIFEPFEPPTRDPPRPPLEFQETDAADEFKSPTTNKEKRQRPTTLAVEPLELVPPLPKSPPPTDISAISNITVEESPSLQIVSLRNPPPYELEIAELPERKFIKAKVPHEAPSCNDIAERRATGYITADMEILDANELELIRPKSQQEPKSSERDSYIKYEKVDEIDEWKEKWHSITKFDIPQTSSSQTTWSDTRLSAHGNDDNSDFQNFLHRNNEIDGARAQFDNSVYLSDDELERTTTKLFDDLELSPEDAVHHIWVKIEQHNTHGSYDDISMEREFREIRHSYEMNEADILDIRQELNEPQEEIETTPTGFGKSIDDDWENFENLSVVVTPEQIWEPQLGVMETVEETIASAASGTATNPSDLFQELEMPTVEPDHTTNVEEENLNMVSAEADTNDVHLPDYDTLMAQREIRENGLPNYETAMENVSKLKIGNDKPKFVSSIEDLYEELSLSSNKDDDNTQIEIPYTDEASDGTAYVSNIDELYKELGIENSVISERAQQASADRTPQPAKRRLQVRFDIDKSKYYQPEELSSESDSDHEYEMPKPTLRSTKLYNFHQTTETTIYESNTDMPTMLFGAQVSDLDEACASSSNSWSAITQHRSMTDRLQQQLSTYMELPNTTQDTENTEEHTIPKPALRNQTINTEAKPQPAARKTSNTSTTQQPSEALLLDIQ